MAERIVVAFKRGESDPVGKSLKSSIPEFLGVRVDSVETRRVYTIDAKSAKKKLQNWKRIHLSIL